MAKVTWLGEDGKEHPGPSFTIWQGIKFPKGKGVEIPEGFVLAKARGNRFFKVTEPKAEAKEETHVAQPKTPAEPAKEESKEPAPTKSTSGYSPAKKKVRKPSRAADKHAHR